MSQLFNWAYRIAKECHDGQLDKGGDSYIEHCIAVAEMAASIGPIAQAVALMHDCLEDNPKIFKKLFVKPDFVSDLEFNLIRESVELLTKPKNITKQQQIKRITDTRNMIAITVKLCDVKHNMIMTRINRDLTAKDLEAFNVYRECLRMLRPALSWKDQRENGGWII